MVAPFSFLGKQFSMYMIMAFIGIIASAIYLYFSTRGKNYRRDHFLEIFAFALIGALIGGHLLYFFTRIDTLIMLIKNDYPFFKSWDHFTDAARTLFGGGVFYGGLFGGILGAYLYCRSSKIDFDLHASAFTPAVPLFHTFGRIGCFMGGCCYGIECESGVRFPYSMTADPEKTYFPIQLVEAAFNLVLFIFLLVLFIKKKPKKVNLLMIYLPVYAAGRFIIEFFRGDSVRGIYFGLSTSQWISIAVIAVSAIIIIKKTSGKHTSNESESL